jgi:hypothetical protein
MIKILYYILYRQKNKANLPLVLWCMFLLVIVTVNKILTNGSLKANRSFLIKLSYLPALVGILA